MSDKVRELKAELLRRTGTDYQDLGFSDGDLEDWLAALESVEETVDWLMQKYDLVDVTQEGWQNEN